MFIWVFDWNVEWVIRERGRFGNLGFWMLSKGDLMYWVIGVIEGLGRGYSVIKGMYVLCGLFVIG